MQLEDQQIAKDGIARWQGYIRRCLGQRHATRDIGDVRIGKDTLCPLCLFLHNQRGCPCDRCEFGRRRFERGAGCADHDGVACIDPVDHRPVRRNVQQYVRLPDRPSDRVGVDQRQLFNRRIQRCPDVVPGGGGLAIEPQIKVKFLPLYPGRDIFLAIRHAREIRFAIRTGKERRAGDSHRDHINIGQRDLCPADHKTRHRLVLHKARRYAGTVPQRQSNKITDSNFVNVGRIRRCVLFAVVKPVGQQAAGRIDDRVILGAANQLADILELDRAGFRRYRTGIYRSDIPDAVDILAFDNIQAGIGIIPAAQQSDVGVGQNVVGRGTRRKAERAAVQTGDLESALWRQPAKQYVGPDQRISVARQTDQRGHRAAGCQNFLGEGRIAERRDPAAGGHLVKELSAQRSGNDADVGWQYQPFALGEGIPHQGQSAGMILAGGVADLVQHHGEQIDAFSSGVPLCLKRVSVQGCIFSVRLGGGVYEPPCPGRIAINRD